MLCTVWNMYRSRADEIYRQITETPPDLTLEQLEEQLSRMVFYEETRPAKEKG